jgi:hypothetical protein
MRATAAFAVVFTFLTLPARAQDAPRPEKCYPLPATGRVVVTMQSGPMQGGMLLCIGDGQVVLASDGRIEAVPLDDVTRIVKPADGIGDGFLKGAAIVGLFALLCGECGTIGHRAAVVVVYGALGAGIDALHGGSETLYERGHAARGAPLGRLAWRVRF